MKSPILLWNMIADDFAIRCCTSTTRDKKTVSGRFEHEGLPFLTITLPGFGADFQKSLNQGLVDRNSFQGFSWRAGLPSFLSGFLGLVFDPGTGVLLDDPDIDAILAVRQLTLLFSKVFLLTSKSREESAMKGYVECEQDVRFRDSCLGPIDFESFTRVSNMLFSSVFARMDYDVHYGLTVPKHGPGATADKLRGNAKFTQRTWPRRLEEVFPSLEHLFPSASYWEDAQRVDILEPGEEIPVKVISVPKTQKTPRIIAVEPTAMQYAQQGLLSSFLEAYERDDVLSYFLGFDDQVPNQDMARQGSSDGTLATLDLSEASDRVSNQLVRAMLSNFPHLQRAVDATRSRKADVPGHGVIRLAKYASMGSALCFPIEACVFLTLIFLGIEKELRTPVSRSLIQQMIGRVRVYGDDIIIPTDYVQSVIESLEHFGARVNSDKSFWIGRFRESCGKEYYDGHDVSVVKVRRLFPTSRQHVPELISLVSLRNQLFKAGCWRAAKWLDSKIVRIIPYYPVVAESSPVLGRFSFLGYETERMHDYLHSPLVRGYTVVSKIPPSPLEGYGALLKVFLKQGAQPFADRRHLERAGRPHAVDIKLRWASPF
jgi:hypothetical protein